MLVADLYDYFGGTTFLYDAIMKYHTTHPDFLSEAFGMHSMTYSVYIV